MHVLIMSEYFPTLEASPIFSGGIESRAYNIARYLSGLGEVSVVASRHREQPTTESHGTLRVYRCGPSRAYVQGGQFVARMQFVRAALRQAVALRPDIVESSNLTTHLAAFRAAAELGVPATAVYADLWIGSWIANMGLVSGLVGEVMERRAVRLPWAAAIALTDVGRDALTRAGVPPQRIGVIPCPVDTKRIRAIQVDKAALPTICCIARLVPYKRVDLLLRAFAALRTEVPALRLVIVGKGQEEKALRQLACDLGIPGDVDFRQGLGYDELLSVLKSATVFCLPSVVEGFGIVLAEAMAAGVPYVAASIPACAAVNREFGGGLLFAPDDVADLTAKLRTLLTDQGVYRSCLQQGAASAERLSVEAVGEQVNQVYEGCLAGKAR